MWKWRGFFIYFLVTLKGHFDARGPVALGAHSPGKTVFVIRSHELTIGIACCSANSSRAIETSDLIFRYLKKIG